MNSNTLTILLICLVSALKSKTEDCFRAAVYEHFQAGNPSTEESTVIIDKNLIIFEDIAVIAAKEGANILVFPEDGIIDPGQYNRTQLRHITEQLPNPEKGQYIACDQPIDKTSKPITYRLSCSAKQNRIYIVANYGEQSRCDGTSDPKCPEDGIYLFNTAVAFGPDGSLIAKYHKSHLAYEDYYNIPAEPEFVFFDTSFGRIALFICFDIVFKHPAIDLIEKYGVETIAFPTWWFDGMGYVTAQQIQEGWSFTNGVNLLAANIHYLGSRSVGSGIYSGQSGPMIVTDVFGKTDQLLIADIPINSRNLSAQCLTNRYNKTIANPRSVDPTDYNVNSTFNTSGSTLFRLSKSSDSVRVCNNGFCCDLNYTIGSGNDLKELDYNLFVANFTGEGRYPICEEICGLFRCEDQNCQKISIHSNQVFRHLEISAQFSTDYSYPMINTNQLKLVPKQYWNLERKGSNGSKFSLTLDRFEEPLLSMLLYGRCYDRDGRTDHEFGSF